MTLTKYRLAELLMRNTETNVRMEYGISDVRGVLNTKAISSTKVDVSDRDLRKFLVVRPGGFIFNHRVHDRLGLGYNTSNDVYIFTNDYVAFYVKPSVAKNILSPDYLYIWFLRNEFDRYMLYKTYGSATLFFSWDNMCELEITLPPLPVQQKYVDIYRAMVANQQSYERGLEDLKLSFDILIDQIMHTAVKKTVGELLLEVDQRNDDGKITNVQGINITKQFMPSVADTNGVDLKKYKIVQLNQFAFSGMQTGRDKCIRIALYKENDPIIISPAYTVFENKDQSVLSEFIMMWFSRDESDRLGWFMSDSSIRSNLDLDRFYETEIPIPEKKSQKSIVEIYSVYSTRRKINEQLKAQIKAICPILIRGSLEEGR
ncbi:MAG: restriction endonuclease subunit S [Anaerolineaceae bacterium]|nr:restriction endonuclease subunit S [Anaerolineaceae bacterium]